MRAATVLFFAVQGIIVALFYRAYRLECSERATKLERSALESETLLVVIPFTIAEAQLLVTQLQTYWLKFLPCRGERKGTPSATIAFYTNTNLDSKWKTLLRRQVATMVGAPYMQHCINPRPLFLSAELSSGKNDTYPLGASLMFFKLFSGQFESLRSISRYMLYMETDLIPCRAGWLSRVASEVYAYDRMGIAFWIRGSIIRYPQRVVSACKGGESLDIHTEKQLQRAVAEYGGGFANSCNLANPTTTAPTNVVLPGTWYKRHINGNAIYNIGDEAFVSFVNNLVAPFLFANLETVLESYDLAIHRVLLDRKLMPWPIYTEIAHKFQLTPTILNFYYRDMLPINFTRECGRREDAFLLHCKSVTT